MPLARIEVEQIEANRWVAEVEAGASVVRRKRVAGASFDEVMAAVKDAYAEMVPQDPAQLPGPRPVSAPILGVAFAAALEQPIPVEIKTRTSSGGAAA